MQSKRLDSSEARLSALRRDLEDEVRKVGETTAASARVLREPGDDADQASDIVEHDSEARVLRVLVHNAQQVDRALELLHGGLYGSCEDCEQEIARERLEALPEATRCLSCQMNHDRTTAGRFSA